MKHREVEECVERKEVQLVRYNQKYRCIIEANFHRDMGVVVARVDVGIRGPVCVEELESSFMSEDIRERVMRVKNKKAPTIVVPVAM